MKFLISIPRTMRFALVLLMVGCSPRHDDEGDHAGHSHAKASDQSESVAICAEHRVPEAECGICRPDLLVGLKAGQSMKVRLPATNSASAIGVETGNPSSEPLSDAVECFAEIAHNQNKLAQVAVPVGGILQEVSADLGTRVEEGQVLARLWSAAIAEAVAKAVLTHQTLDRERRLRIDRVTSEKDLQEAEAVHRGACQQLRTLGFTEEQIDTLGSRPQESVLLEVRAPFAGEVVERAAVRGALVEAGKALFTVADRSVVWAMLNLPEASLGRVRVGQEVEVRVDALPERAFPGKLTWIGPEVDERSRMARARAEVANPDGLLKARMFAQARVKVAGHQAGVVVPRAAVQSVNQAPFVFVSLAPDLFEARAVRLGLVTADRAEVTEGLQMGEGIVVRHAYALKSQLLSSRLGAGCADD